jgi:hypothetical protein
MVRLEGAVPIELFGKQRVVPRINKIDPIHAVLQRRGTTRSVYGEQ